MNTKLQSFLHNMKNYYHWSNKIEFTRESFLQCAGYLLRTRILIKGVNNSLEIAENTKIFNYDIVIKGSENSLVIEKDCAANGNHVSLKMWKEEDE